MRSYKGMNSGTLIIGQKRKIAKMTKSPQMFPINETSEEYGEGMKILIMTIIEK
ncbi:hypothetical protein [Microbulbifer variabilis]|uniref:hypothetical protein n=1 Tax=Microbulbifer variabilis TaxID=266805 RepID=UPI001CFCD39B|nr:hypothetical protein [Microbulbifer variabilis]